MVYNVMPPRIMDEEDMVISTQAEVWGKENKMATITIISDADVSALDASIAAIPAGEGTPFNSAIGMTYNVIENTGVRSRDRVTVCPTLDVAFGKVVLVLL